MVDPLNPTVKPDGVGAEAAAHLVLEGLPGVARRMRKVLVEHFGTATAVLETDDEGVAGLEGVVPAPIREGLGERRDAGRWRDARAVVDAAEAAGLQLLVPGGPDYPTRLGDLADPPAPLFATGRTSILVRNVVTVVGSRAATAYGRRVTEEVVRALVGHGVVVASGMALGIDGAAHRAALEAGGDTIAVLGTGADVPYPARHRALYRQIAEHGLVVSELRPGTRAQPHQFPERNRILAGLARAVVVVEAGRKSGALITARSALELGRDVLAVPGSIYAPRSRGTNRLLRDGAGAVVDAFELPVLLPWLEATGADRGPRMPPRRLGPEAGAVWRRLDEAPRSVGDLARSAGLPPDRTLAALSTLEVKGWAGRQPGMRFVRTSPGAASAGQGSWVS